MTPKQISKSWGWFGLAWLSAAIFLLWILVSPIDKSGLIKQCYDAGSIPTVYKNKVYCGNK